MPFTVYILHSSFKDKFYIGTTSDLQQRIIRHNQKSKGFTGKTNDWILVYHENFENKTDAIAREKQIIPITFMNELHTFCIIPI